MCASSYNKNIMSYDKEKKASWNEKQEIATCTVTQSYVFAFLIGKHSFFRISSFQRFAFFKPANTSYISLDVNHRHVDAKKISIIFSYVKEVLFNK